MARQSKKIVFQKKCKTVLFQIRETGQNWSIYFKEPRKSFKKIQSVSNLLLAKQIVNNQRECR